MKAVNALDWKGNASWIGCPLESLNFESDSIVPSGATDARNLPESVRSMKVPSSL